MNNKITVLLAVILLFTVAKAGNFGYVVKIDADKVYVDTTELSIKPEIKDGFAVFIEGEELFNPVTRKSLGKIKNKVSEGTIIETSEKYALGQAQTGADKLKIGQKVEIISRKIITASAQKNLEDNTSSQNIIWKSKPIEGKIYSVSLGDVNLDGKNELICGFKHKLKVYSVENGKLKTLYEFTFSNLFNLVSAQSKKFKEVENIHIFVTGRNEISETFSTKVLSVQNGKLKETEELKWMVQSALPLTGEKTLYAQQLYKSGGMDKSKITELVYKKGKFKTKKIIKMPRLKTLYSFNLTDFEDDGKPELIYITKSDKIRVQKKRKGSYYDSKRIFGKTPKSFTARNKTLYFQPRIILHKDENGQSFVYGIENLLKKGLFARSFGMYQNAVLHKLHWTGSILKSEKETTLSGYLYDITKGKFAGLEEGIICPSVTLDNETIIEILSY